MKFSLADYIIKVVSKNFSKLFPESEVLKNNEIDFYFIKSVVERTKQGEHVKLYAPHHIYDSSIGSYTYIAKNANISLATIGYFCSIGPNFLCGWGIHPVDGISTHPMFYSTQKPNGISLSAKDKVVEREKIEIGNDVFIGANVTILDGVKIGNGAVIGAGAVVSKDIPPYAIAVGSPINIVKFRHTPEIIEKLNKIKWWEWEPGKLKEVEKYFNKVEEFVKLYS
jgi:virginiamycin A acetyltransferase